MKLAVYLLLIPSEHANTYILRNQASMQIARGEIDLVIGTLVFNLATKLYLESLGFRVILSSIAKAALGRMRLLNWPLFFLRLLYY